MTWTNPKRPEAGLDIELFHNWFLIGITDALNGTQWDYQLTPGGRLDVQSIVMLLQYYTIITFNGVNYDLPILLLALEGADNATLKQANDEIIEKGFKWWVIMKKYGLRVPPWLDHIDVMEPTPGVRVSLKQYMCRMHSELIQDSPVDFKIPIPTAHIPQEIGYCRNDRKGTLQLRQTIKSRIDLRIKLSERVGIDLRSKSDAQMAEAMVKVEWSRRLREQLDNLAPSVRDFDVGYDGTLKPQIPKFPHGFKFHCVIPEYVHFVTPYMQDVLALVRSCEFTLTDKDEALILSDGEEELGPDGKKLKTGVIMPAELKGLDIVMAGSAFRMGIGGLHSREKKTTWRSDPLKGTMRTADVAAYYVQLIVNSGMNPPQLGPLFQEIYGGFKKIRDQAKITLKTLAETAPERDEIVTVTSGYKVVNVGTFGKLFSRHSIFYYPLMAVSVTVGGQLSLLMLMERLTISGIRVVSANTDGLELFVPQGLDGVCDQILAWWERTCTLTLEVSSYMALCSESVNSYVSLQFDASVKRKGRYGRSGVISPDAPAGKHPDIDICAEAVIAWLSRGVPMSQTIRGCTDIRMFVRVRGAKGGARMSTDLPDMNYGRAVRWYYSTQAVGDYIVDATSGSKVAGSDGARLCLRMPTQLPADVDYAFYEATAEKMLLDMGVGG